MYCLHIAGTLGHNTMRTHAFLYTVTLLLSIHEVSFAEIESLFPKGKTFLELFRPRVDVGALSWRSIIGGKESSGFYVCNSEEWLQSEALDSAEVKELTVKIVYAHYENDNKTLLNKTAFHLGVVGKNDQIESFSATGVINITAERVTSSALVPVNYPKGNIRVLIKAPDKNDCMFVYAVDITSKYCAEKTFGKVARFSKTYAPRTGSPPLEIQGECSFGRTKPVAYCGSDGFWTFNETIPCSCAPGEVMSDNRCAQLPPILEDVQAVRLSNTRATISWKQKHLANVRYSVVCKKCRRDGSCEERCLNVRQKETKSYTKDRNTTTITGLERGQDYLFTVVGKIDPNNEKYENKTSKEVYLRALPEEVRNLSFTSRNHESVTLTWRTPNNIKSNSIAYAIECEVHCLGESCPSVDCGKLKFFPSRRELLGTTVTIKGFTNEGSEYVFKVLAKHRVNQSAEIEWNYVAINYTADFKEKIAEVSKSFNIVDVIIGISVLVLAVIITIIGTRFYNRWKRRKRSMSFVGENPDPFLDCEVPLTELPTQYVNPSNYASIENVLRRFTKKLSERNLKTEVIIGEGEFGVVWKGYLETEGNGRITVAVKNLRSGLSSKLRRDFLAEATVMGQFKDPNVISLHGVVVKKHSVKIVMEYMSNGSLDQYLVRNNGRLTTLELLRMARGIASGMTYLSGRNFIHRDLAARNILVDENRTCKVSDFGLTREICQTSNYETRGGKIPIRWTAPEVIKHRKSFIASDVWSYGVVLWEIMSFGQRPYWGWDNFRVLQEIETGYRLPAPLKCPKTVHSLMLHCWEKERPDRPTFLHILNKLEEWIRSPETIKNSPATKAKRNTVEPVQCQSPIHEWLESIKMGKYAPNFAEAGYDQLSQIANLTEQDLTDLGITLVGHRHKIHQSIPLVT